MVTAVLALIVGFLVGIAVNSHKKWSHRWSGGIGGGGHQRGGGALSTTENSNGGSNDRRNGRSAEPSIAANGKLTLVSAGTEIYDKTLALKR